MEMSTFDGYGNPIETTADKINWNKFLEWIKMKVVIKNENIEDTLENRVMLMNKVILEGKKIIHLGKPFEI